MLAGGSATVLFTGPNGPAGLAVDSGHVYWANQQTGPDTGTINEASLPDGSNPRPWTPSRLARSGGGG